MNVTELARRVKIPTERLRDIIPELGYGLGRRAIKIDDKQANEIIQKLNDPAVREQYIGVKEEEKEEGGEQQQGVVLKEGIVQIPDEITVKDLAVQLDVPTTELILTLMRNGVMAAQNETIDYETASIVAEDFGYEPQRIFVDQESEEETVEDREEMLISAEDADTEPRAPVVVVMGHVDHGKTKLLDAIRETNVVEGEHGGITQHIGAYQVTKNDREITFIDTPGHEAFTAMRSRGARVADIAILVVAADDGVQPQTIEALSHIQRAEIPFVVAINKIDKEGADPNRVKQGLADVHVQAEDWGGKTPMVPVSALKGKGIDDLLEMILLVADLNKDSLVAEHDTQAVGTIIESHVDKGEGPVATVLIQKGTLRKGDAVQVGDIFGGIRAMRDYTGEDLSEAGPSVPAKILGMKTVPKVGDILFVPEDVKKLKKEARKSRKRKGVPEVARTRLVQNTTTGGSEQVHVVLKADVLGTLEAIYEALEPVQQQSGESLKIVSKGLGAVTDADAMKAADQDALLIGFNVSVMPAATEYARNKNMTIHSFSVIYDLINLVKEEVEKVLPADVERTDIGKMKFLKLFKTDKKEAVIGCRVSEGQVTKDSKLDVRRGEKMVATVSIEELQSGKEEVNEVMEGQDCGLRVSGYTDFQDGDVLEVYTTVEKKRVISV